MHPTPGFPPPQRPARAVRAVDEESWRARRARVGHLGLAVLAMALVATVASPARAAVPQISTVAGTGTSGFAGDGGPATAALLSVPVGLAMMPDGGYLIVDQANQRIRRVAANGTISTIAGSGAVGYGGDGAAAVAASLQTPNAVAVAADGSVLIGDSGNNRIRRVRPDGKIETAAGTDVAGYNGDGAAATSTNVNFPMGVVALPGGGFVFADNDNGRIRKVDASGIVSTIATAAGPAGVARYADGTLLVTEMDGNRVLRIAPGASEPTVVAGTGAAGGGGDGGPATSAQLSAPDGVAILPDGGFVIADSGNHKIRRVDPAGTITTIAGDGTSGTGGDGGPATSAQLTRPFGVAATTAGDVLVADVDSHRVRRIGLSDVTPPPVAVSGPGTVPRFTIGTFVMQNASRASGFQVTVGNAILPCAPQQTVIKTRFPLPGSFRIGVAATLLAGGTATSSETVTVPGAAPPGDAAATLQPIVTCAVPPGTEYDITDGGPPSQCSTSARVGIGVMIGCLTIADKTAQLGTAERAIVFRLYKEIADLPWFVRWAKEQNVAPCSVVDATCTPDYIAKSGGLLFSTRAVRISGLDLVPANGHAVVISQLLSRVVCRDCRVMAGQTVLAGHASVNWSLDADPRVPSHAYQPLAAYVPEKRVPTVGGLVPPAGAPATVEIAQLADGSAVSRVTFPLQVPSFLINATGSPQAVYDGDNRHGYPDLGGTGRGPVRAPIGGGVPQHFELPDVEIVGGVALEGVSADYDPAKDEWRFEGILALADLAKIQMKPEPGFPDGGLTLGSDGSFGHAGAKMTFPGPGVELFGPLTLKSITVLIYLKPYTSFDGEIDVRFAEIAYATGRVVAAFPDEEPYQLKPAKDWGDAGTQEFYTPVFGANAHVGLDLPIVGKKELGSGWLVFTPAGYFDVGGRIGFDLWDVVSLDGSVEGTFNFASGNFQITAQAHADLLDWDIASAFFRVSNRGFVVCGHVSLAVYDIDPGVAVWTDGDYKIWFDGCRPGAVDVNLTPPQAPTGLRDAAPLVIDLPAGTRARTITLHGTAGAPRLVVTGPGGEVVQSGGTKNSRHLHIVSSNQLKMTAVGIVGGPAGRYTITLLPGSPAVADASYSDEPDPIRLTASANATTPAGPTRGTRKAAAKPRTRTLRWHVNASPKQTITFVERGAGIEHVLLTTAKASGVLRYTPAVGATRGRRVEAEVYDDGLPAAAPQVVARYLVAKPARPAPARKVRAAWKKRRLVVRWLPAANATGYRVDVIARSGARIHVEAKAKARSVRLAGVPITSAGTVRVTTLGALNRTARPRVVRYARLVAPKQGALPWSELTARH